MAPEPLSYEIREMSERLSARRALFDSTHDSHLLADLQHLLRRLALAQQEARHD